MKTTNCDATRRNVLQGRFAQSLVLCLGLSVLSACAIPTGILATQTGVPQPVNAAAAVGEAVPNIRDIADQGVLIALLSKSLDPRLRQEIVWRLTDQIALVQIAQQDRDVTVRAAALSRVRDQRLLFQAALEDSDSAARVAAALAIEDQQLISQLAAFSKEQNVLRALVKTTDNQDVLKNIAIDNSDPVLRRLAIGRLTDEKLLAIVALEDRDEDNRHLAAKRISKQDALLRVALGSAEWAVNEIVLKQLDGPSLTIVARAAKDLAVQLAANVLIGQTTWDLAMQTGYASDKALGNLIGALALIREPVPQREPAAHAILTFVKKHNKQRTAELVALLWRFGTPTVAQAYTFSGNKELAEMATRWRDFYDDPWRLKMNAPKRLIWTIAH